MIVRFSDRFTIPFKLFPNFQELITEVADSIENSPFDEMFKLLHKGEIVTPSYWKGVCNQAKNNNHKIGLQAAWVVNRNDYQFSDESDRGSVSLSSLSLQTQSHL